MAKSRGSFGVFLDTFEKETSQRSRHGKHDLLHLFPAEGTVPVSDLYEESSLGFATFSKTLSGMQESGLIEVALVEEKEMARLTDLGARLLSKG